MANGDRVIISGFDGVKEWATEKTASDTLSVLSSFSKTNQKQLDSIIKVLKKSTNYSTEQLDNLNDALSDLEDTTEDLDSALSDLEDAADGAATDVKKGGSTFGKALSNFASDLGNLALNGLIYSTGAFLTGLVDMTSSVQTLTQNGISLAGEFDGVAAGMGTFGATARDANVSLQELADITKEYGNVMNQFGIRRFGRVAKSMSADMTELGLTTSETSEYLASNLETLRTSGNLARMNESQQRAAVVASIKQTDQWSKVLGKSRKELEAQAKAATESGRASLALRQLGPEMKGAMDEITKSLGPAGEDFLSTMTAANLAATDQFQALGAAGLGEARGVLTSAYEAFQAGDVEGFKAQFAEYNKTLANSSKAQLHQLQVQETFGVVTAANVDSVLASIKVHESLESVERNRVDAAKQEQAYLNERIKAEQSKLILDGKTESQQKVMMENAEKKAKQDIANEKKTQKELREATATFENTKKQLSTIPEQMMASVMGNVDVMNFLNDAFLAMGPAIEILKDAFFDLFKVGVGGTASALSGFTTYITDAATSIAEWLKTLKGEDGSIDFDKMFSDMISKITEPLKDALISGIKYAFAGLGIALLFKKMVLGPMASMLTGGGGGDTGGKKSKGGGIGGGIGKALGGLTSGILGGIAKGLMAFANPQVVIGAAAFSAAVVLISGAVAGAAFLLGSAMPKLAEGMRELETLDGQALQQVGLGIGAVGLGMAAFGSGGVVGAVGGAIGGLVEGLSGLMGGKSSIEKLREFAEIGPGLKEAGDGMLAISSGLVTFSDALSGLPDSTDALEDMVDAINDLDVDKLTKLTQMRSAAYSVNATGNNATTTQKLTSPISTQLETGVPIKSDEAQTPSGDKGSLTKTPNSAESSINTLMKENNALLKRLVDVAGLGAENTRKVRKQLQSQEW